MFVIKLDDSLRYPPVYFCGFCKGDSSIVMYGPLSDAIRFNDIIELLKFQQAILDRTPHARLINEYVG